MFIDEAKIHVKGGNGGNGCVSLHHEKYNPRGGPDGGNGGNGGNVILEGSRNLNTLNVFKKRVHIKASKGNHGQGDRKNGRNADDTIVEVPLGTVIFDAETGGFIGEIMEPGEQVRVAKGGRGGRGNAAFATKNYRLPKFAEKGEKGQERWIKLEMRVLAHVGLVGLPNAGKSTFLASVTAAKPKIADYPFTTLSPNLGVVEAGLGRSYIFADIPGLIEGASTGAGLGHKFLKHISRTKMLIHLIDLTTVDPGNPLLPYEVIMKELADFSQVLLDKPMIVALNKIDIVGTEEAFFAARDAFEKLDLKVFPVSAASLEGINPLLDEVFKILKDLGEDFIKSDRMKDEFVVIDEKTELLQPFVVEKVDDYYVVRGKRPETMIQMADLENEEALRYIQTSFRKMGVDDKLKELGAADGDTVVVADFEFDYIENKEI